MMNIISILKFYPLDQTKMSNDEIIKQILVFLKKNVEDTKWICEVIEWMVSSMIELEKRVSLLEDKEHRNDRTNKRRVSKLVEESEWLEGVL